jgi:hypothetical protein
MGNLASTYCHLGRHQDALVLQEKALEFSRRVMPENHPFIGETRDFCSVLKCLLSLFTRCYAAKAMGQLAVIYRDLGRHHDALALQTKTLEFLQRVHPEDLPGIGMLCVVTFTSFTSCRN